MYPHFALEPAFKPTSWPICQLVPCSNLLLQKMCYADPYSVIHDNKLLVWVKIQLSDPSALVWKLSKFPRSSHNFVASLTQQAFTSASLFGPIRSSIIAKDVQYLMDYIPLCNWYLPLMLYLIATLQMSNWWPISRVYWPTSTDTWLNEVHYFTRDSSK